MTAYLLTLHVLELVLPAALLALLVVSLAAWLPGWGTRRPGLTWRGRWFWTFAANLAVSLAGLAMWGADGKMATYGALVLVSALVQFFQWRAWRP